jgi:GxxExxY protein
MKPTEPKQMRNGTGDARLEHLAHVVIGAAIEVHRELGPGYLESIYEKAMAIELSLRGIPFAQQFDVPVGYKGQKVGTGTLDFFVADQLVVELKAVDALRPVHTAQLMSYLKDTLGLLINFNVTAIRNGLERIVL